MARLTKAQLKGKVATKLPDNMTGEVSVADVREILVDLIDSLDEEGTDDAFHRPTFEEIQDGISAVPRVWSATDVKTGVGEYQPEDYAPGTDGPTTTQPRTFAPDNIAEIAEDVVDDGLGSGGNIKQAIDGAIAAIPPSQPGSGGGLDQDAVDARVAAGIQTHAGEANVHHTPPDTSGVVEELNEFEQALRVNSDIIRTYAETIAVAGAAARIGNVLLPSAEAERELIITINNGTRDTTYTADLADIRDKPSVSQTQQMRSTNAVVIPNSADAEEYYIGHGGGNNQLFFSSDTVGSYRVTIVDSRIDLEDFARRSSTAMVPASKLPEAQEAGLDQDAVDARVQAALGTHTADADAHHTPPDAGLATVATDDTIDGDGTAGTPLKVADPYTAAKVNDAISARLNTIDAVFTATFTGAAGTAQDAGNTGVFTTLPTNFTIGATTYHVEQVFQDGADNDLWIGFSSRLPDGYAVQINEHKVALRYVTTVGGDFRYLADGAPAGTIVVGSNTITIYKPLSEANFVPGGGQPGQALEAGADGDPEWRTLPIPRSAIQELAARQTQGIVITSAALANRTNLLDFNNDSAFVIGQKHGLVFVSVEWTVVGPVNLKLGDDVLDAFQLTLSDLRASSAYAADSVQGVKVASVELVRTNPDDGTKIGDVDLYLAKDATDQIHFWLNHTTEHVATTAQTATSVQAILNVDVFEHDGAAAASGGGGLSSQATITIPGTNAAVATGYTLPETGLVALSTQNTRSGVEYQVLKWFDAALIRGLTPATVGTNLTGSNSLAQTVVQTSIARGNVFRVGRTAANELLVGGLPGGSRISVNVRVYGP